VSVALVTQHAKRMCHIKMSLVNRLAFQLYLINGRIFGKKKVIAQKMCVLIFSTTFV